jgi:hypothetical protein
MAVHRLHAAVQLDPNHETVPQEPVLQEHPLPSALVPAMHGMAVGGARVIRQRP